DVEIGFGNGEFLVRTAQEHPERHFVGIEQEWASVQRGLRRLAQAELRNVRLLLVDARIAMERLFAPQTIQRVYALFPCPWPKERHIRHRLFAHTFLTLLNSRLVPTGEVQVVTDQQPYVDWVLEQVPETGFIAAWSPIAPSFHTKYERKWYETGQHEFFDLRLQKTSHLSSPLREDVTLQTHRIAQFNPAQFPLASLHGPITVTCKEFLYDPQKRKGLVWVFVAEEGLTQDFWIEIARSGMDWTIRPARGCGIVPTVGVQSALDLVRDTAQQTVS
ncbi:MAG: tRNA (guanosine(46)-N7)-methyltransferase TrmB, partial [Candidatus Tectomicrobia bacterium]|nr:tRNA (guanosine(46)-N7)-methyltransferase TrmB [Candidatus Tectomicrobia bacterium]